MANKSRDLGDQNRDRSLESGRRRGEILFLTEKADHINHRDLSYTTALIGGAASFGVVTTPNTEKALAEPLQGR